MNNINKYGVGVFINYPIPGIVNRKQTPTYQRWSSMMRRACSNVFKEKNVCYSECSICEEWLEYQKFAEWESRQKMKDGVSYHIDKDILNKGNKHYSPENCRLIPAQLNCFFSTLPTTPKVLFQGRKFTIAPTLNGVKMYKGFDSHKEAVDYYWEIKQIALDGIVEGCNCFIDEQILKICKDVRKWAES